MRILIDTQSYLWFIEGSPRLSAPARHLIQDPGNERFLSVASVWEIAIKVSPGKLSLHQPFTLACCVRNGRLEE
jgi:PIN domain nuclease of toxin-antitoxin system